MNWLTAKLPGLSFFTEKKDVPDNLWAPCNACNASLFTKDLESNLRVCPHCANHMPISAQERLVHMFDSDKWKKLPMPKLRQDPLGFKDKKKYTDRIKADFKKDKCEEAMMAGIGTIMGQNAVIACQDFTFMAGSMGTLAGEIFYQACVKAVKEKVGLVAICSSGGMRMQEGLLSLVQMPKVVLGIKNLRMNKLPYIVVLTHPTTGGVTASFAMLGDVTLAEPNALIGFAGPRVIEQTLRETLPEGFQRSEYLKAHGMLDLVVERKDLKEKIAQLIKLLTNQHSLQDG